MTQNRLIKLAEKVEVIMLDILSEDKPKKIVRYFNMIGEEFPRINMFCMGKDGNPIKKPATIFEIYVAFCGLDLGIPIIETTTKIAFIKELPTQIVTKGMNVSTLSQTIRTGFSHTINQIIETERAYLARDHDVGLGEPLTILSQQFERLITRML